jgi:hypothetical protein
VVRNGTLYWEVRVVPDSSAGVTYTAFVNAETSNVIRYADDRRVKAFIAGEVAPGDGQAPDNGTDGEEPGMVVLVLDEDGTVVREIPVQKNESIRVEQASNRTTATPA